VINRSLQAIHASLKNLLVKGWTIGVSFLGILLILFWDLHQYTIDPQVKCLQEVK